MENNIKQLDNHELNYIKRKFGFDNIKLEQLDSNSNQNQLNITHSSIGSYNKSTTKNSHSSSFVIQPDHQKIKQIIHKTNKQTNKNENRQMLQSKKYNINAIIKMMHSNYKKIVEYDEDSIHHYTQNNYLSSSSSTNDEKASKSSVYFLLTSSYKFISASQDNNNSLIKKVKLPFVKFLQLQDKCIYIMMYYIFNQYNDLLSSHELIGNKIVLSLNHLFNHSIELFKYTYKSVLELQEYYFKYSHLKKGKYIYPLFDLFIKSKISHEAKTNMCYEISFVYNFIHTSSKYNSTNDPIYHIQTIKFDIKQRSNCLYWFASEFQETKNSIGRVCYSQPITPYALGDYLLFRINIFNVDGYIDPSSIIWKEVVIDPIKVLNASEFEKKILKSKLVFDKFRCCEIEQITHIWKTVDQLTNKRTIDEFTSIVNKCFEIKEIYYNVTNLYLFKICLKAIKNGLIENNKYSNIAIEVIQPDNSTTNECQWMGTLNVKYEMKKIQIRCGDKVLFYLSDLYY